MKNFIKKISLGNKILSVVLLLAVVFTVVQVVLAVSAIPNPGHNISELGGYSATGDLLYGTSGTTGGVSGLADAATGNALISGGAGGIPSYGKIGLTTHVSGILGSANGGTDSAYFDVAGPTQVRTYTFPDAAATIARTDAGQTFTGVQTMTSPAITTPAFTGAFTGTYTIGGTPTLGAATWSGTQSAGGNQLNNVVIGTSTPLAGSFTSLTATGVITYNTTTNAQSYTTSGAGTITITSGTLGAINNMSIGATTAASGAFTSLSASGGTTLSGSTGLTISDTKAAGTCTSSSSTTCTATVRSGCKPVCSQTTTNSASLKACSVSTTTLTCTFPTTGTNTCNFICF